MWHHARVQHGGTVLAALLVAGPPGAPMWGPSPAAHLDDLLHMGAAPQRVALAPRGVPEYVPQHHPLVQAEEQQVLQARGGGAGPCGPPQCIAAHAPHSRAAAVT